MVEHIRNHYLKRSTLFQAFETQVAKLKSSRDINAFQVRVLYFSYTRHYRSIPYNKFFFQAAAKNITSDLRAQILDLPSSLKSESPQLNDRVTELQKQDK